MITASLVIYHNSRQEIDMLLESVLRSPIDKLYIVDNSRHDLYRTLEHRSSRFRYIHNANDGYGAAHNIAMREAIALGAKYHIVINPDIYFDIGTVEALAQYMDNHEKVGWVMPKIVYPNGEIQHLCKLLPTPTDLIVRRFVPKGLLRKSREKFNPKISGREVNLPYLSGCFMFLRVSALQRVGLFDERFFMYGEDLDLSRRMHSHYRTVYYPNATVVHAHRAESYHSLKMLWIHIKNIAMYFNKWGWFFDAEEDADKLVLLREAGRLRTSIRAAKETGLKPVVFLHYPPRYADQICDEILAVLQEEQISHCYYGHVHGNGIRLAVQGTIDDIDYRLISADALHFCPILINIGG